MDGEKYIPLIVEKLKKASPEKIILFGSYAYGTPTKDSDIDIMVVTSDEKLPSNFAEKSAIYFSVYQTISDVKKEFPIDLIVHTKTMHQLFIKTNSLFARELISKGKILYEMSDENKSSHP